MWMVYKREEKMETEQNCWVKNENMLVYDSGGAFGAKAI